MTPDEARDAMQRRAIVYSPWNDGVSVVGVQVAIINRLDPVDHEGRVVPLGLEAKWYATCTDVEDCEGFVTEPRHLYHNPPAIGAPVTPKTGEVK